MIPNAMLAPDGDFSTIEKQSIAHRPQIAKAGTFGVNHFGQPEGYCVYNSPIGLVECTVDLTLARVRPDDPRAKHGVKLDALRDDLVICTGVQFMCPKCGGGCYINGDADAVKDGARGVYTIIIHWDDLRKAENDQQIRPTFTVLEPVGCDYSWSEVNGIVAPRNGVLNRCGFRSMFEKGRQIPC